MVIPILNSNFSGNNSYNNKLFLSRLQIKPKKYYMINKMLSVKTQVLAIIVQNPLIDLAH